MFPDNNKKPDPIRIIAFILHSDNITIEINIEYCFQFICKLAATMQKSLHGADTSQFLYINATLCLAFSLSLNRSCSLSLLIFLSFVLSRSLFPRSVMSIHLSLQMCRFGIYFSNVTELLDLYSVIWNARDCYTSSKMGRAEPATLLKEGEKAERPKATQYTP